MSSIKPSREAAKTPPWMDAGNRYYRLGDFLRRQFGEPVWKVSVDAGLSCPNVDGTLSSGGCIFCNTLSFSPSRRLQTASISEQIRRGTERLRSRRGVEKFLAYFQPATNTHAPIERLKAAWNEALAQPGVVGLIVGTRPDCVGDDVLDLLTELAQRTWVSVEYGLQTIHDRSLEWMNRGHDHAAFLDAVDRSRGRGFHLGAHLILGIPGETRADMLATAREVARLGLDSVKLHNLYVVKNTRLATAWRAGRIVLPDRDEYVQCVVDFLEQLPPACVIDRLSGDAPPEYLLAPDWCRDKSRLQRAITAELERRDTRQGQKFTTAQ